MKANDQKFTKGQRVRFSEEAFSENIVARRRKTSVGTVVGYGREPGVVRVVLDGNKTITSCHDSFLETVVPLSH